ncbi:hypothetical protein J6590_002136 [Homalodisca vitripennis]|nr:hypothetical protein J6590_002136 [Homalodisca vitripennis]
MKWLHGKFVIAANVVHNVTDSGPVGAPFALIIHVTSGHNGPVGNESKLERERSSDPKMNPWNDLIKCGETVNVLYGGRLLEPLVLITTRSTVYVDATVPVHEVREEPLPLEN